ncbi:hypothetical protein [Roseofilum sp. Guam]|uniref:hypothetical protein n=1 Tax=Roseofilum sp. Guam TaxID=2821502 RepID=UPI001AFD7234|nr:hypothetical protein [Roseofilum sp. Guam]MBP0029857.1 hypothetical protein [Roseofilum sp. Guam]
MKIEIVGQDAEVATEELLSIAGIEGSYETVDEPQKAEVLTTISTIVGIVGGTMAIAKQLYEWYQKSQKKDSGRKLEKVMIVTDDGRRLLLKDATVEQIKELLE